MAGSTFVVDLKKKRKLSEKYLRTCAGMLLVWILGYLGFHYTWLILGFAIYVMWKWKKELRKQNREALQKVTENPEDFLPYLKNLPAWMNYPDMSKADWLNDVVERMWPYISQMVHNIIMTTVQKKVISFLPSFLKDFHFEECDLGTKPPRVGGVKIYSRHTRKDEILLDVELIFASDSKVSVNVKGISAGISDIQIRGKMRIEIGPLIPRAPLIGGVTVYFIDSPDIDFDLTSLLNVLDVPGISGIFRNTLHHIIDDFLVLPNRITIPLIAEKELERLMRPLPDGLLSVTVIEAKELVASDKKAFSKDSSDPYALVKVGAKAFQTKTVENSLKPKWNESFEMFVDTLHGQKLNLKILDEDIGNDDSLGHASIDILALADKGTMDEWIPLRGTKSGKVHVFCAWRAFSTNSKSVSFKKPPLVSTTPDGKHGAFAALFVTVRKAANLTPTNLETGTCSPFVEIKMGETELKTDTIENTKEPVWDQMVRFLVTDPKKHLVKLKIKDEDENMEPLGDLEFNAELLLMEPNMEISREFPLEHCFSNGSTLTLTFKLVGLVSDAVEK